MAPPKENVGGSVFLVSSGFEAPKVKPEVAAGFGVSAGAPNENEDAAVSAGFSAETPKIGAAAGFSSSSFFGGAPKVKPEEAGAAEVPKENLGASGLASGNDPFGAFGFGVSQAEHLRASLGF